LFSPARLNKSVIHFCALTPPQHPRALDNQNSCHIMFPGQRGIAMNKVINDNQHYVSQVLQRRFAVGGFLERFDLEWNKWKRVSTARIFSRLGYSQLLAYGLQDNTLDESFQKYENALNDTLAALDDAVNKETTELSDEVCTNLFWYCAYIS